MILIFSNEAVPIRKSNTFYLSLISDSSVIPENTLSASSFSFNPASAFSRF